MMSLSNSIQARNSPQASYFQTELARSTLWASFPLILLYSYDFYTIFSPKSPILNPITPNSIPTLIHLIINIKCIQNNNNFGLKHQFISKSSSSSFSPKPPNSTTHNNNTPNMNKLMESPTLIA